MEQRVSIMKRLENASVLLSETASYQTVYAGCLEVDIALSKGQLQGAVDTIPVGAEGDGVRSSKASTMRPFSRCSNARATASSLA